MNHPNPFFDTFFKKLDRVHQVLEQYLEDPSEKNIHDIRTSIRKLESAYSIIPKSRKTKKSDKLIRQFKKFFSQNNIIRDYDIILEKLKESNYDPESKLVLTLTKKKLKKLSKTIGYAEKLSNLKNPKIKANDKINSKFEKRISTLIEEFQNYIPIVISNESKVKELHAMRKTTKKLRYVLELDPNNSFQNLVSKMKKLQKLLGDIHDCDIFIWYFEKKKNEIPNLVKFEKTKRSNIYQNLVSTLSGFKSGKS